MNDDPKLFTQEDVTAILEKQIAAFDDEYCKHDDPLIGIIRARKALRSNINTGQAPSLAERDRKVRLEEAEWWYEQVRRAVYEFPTLSSNLAARLTTLRGA